MKFPCLLLWLRLGPGLGCMSRPYGLGACFRLGLGALLALRSLNQHTPLGFPILLQTLANLGALSEVSQLDHLSNQVLL